jgi:DNA invertase Pin-like site-specific DNA recombinase
VRKWNKFVRQYNATVRSQAIGRPLAASEAQQRQVLALRKDGTALRAIATATGLGIRTVRTILGKADGDAIGRPISNQR